MSGFTRSPRTVSGGFVVMDAGGKAVQRTIAFQYNPDSVTRSLVPRGARGGQGDGLEALRLTGPASETLKFDIEIDATDKLEKPASNATAVSEGIGPELAVLETLFSPSVADMTANRALAQSGTLEILPLPSALVILVLGTGRTLPVRITEFSVVEEAFDINLNPIRARMAIGLSVLTVDDLAWGSKGAELFLAAQSSREKRALLSAASLQDLGLSGAP